MGPRRWFAAAFLLALVTIAVLTTCCGRRDLDAVGSADTPLILVLSPSHRAEAADVAALTTLLSDRSGLRVEIVVADSAEVALRRIGNRQADAGLLPGRPT